MRINRFLRQLHRTLTGPLGVGPGDGLILAVSGGPDSMSLLHGVAGVNVAFDMHWRLIVAHLNHQTRGPDSDADAAFVAESAEKLGLPAVIESADVPARCGAEGGGLEREGRRARYDFFARLARQHGCAWVATGHHADDNAETILQRIIRGTGPRGLAGIPASRPLGANAALDDGRQVRLIRPLLALRRRTIERFLASNGIAFRTDASNLSIEPTRNWLRHELIPLIAKPGVGNPGVVPALLRLGELSGWVSAFLEESAGRLLDSLLVDRTDTELTLNAAALAGEREILQAEFIRQAIVLLGPAEFEIGLRHLKAVMGLASGDSTSRVIHLPGGMTAQRRGGQLVLRRRGPAEQGQPDERPADDASLAAASVSLPGCTVLPMAHRKIVIDLLDNGTGLLADFKANRPAGVEMIDADQLHPPLSIRLRRPGDRFWPLGASGTKKVGDFLSDHKVPPMDRDRVFLLCDQLGPVWVIPHRIDDRVRVTERTGRVARLRMEPI
jgi:tRNA(Ile)-lysidine synthase